MSLGSLTNVNRDVLNHYLRAIAGTLGRIATFRRRTALTRRAVSVGDTGHRLALRSSGPWRAAQRAKPVRITRPSLGVRATVGAAVRR
jgi:hypothetical protein